jgi:predicted metal-dependent HD superfamily phosphohydrolase
LDATKTGQDDVHYFLDFDMAILGSSKEGEYRATHFPGVHVSHNPKHTFTEYDTYKKQIREEYAHYDDTTYAQGRLKVLRLFLQIPNIFATKEFRENYELRARQNIAREIEELQAKLHVV